MNLEDAKKLAAARLAELGLTAQGWTFRFNRKNTQFGLCKQHCKVLEFSAPLIACNPEAMFVDTLNHEAAHALVGCGHGHGPVWQAKAVELGASPRSKVPRGAANFPFRFKAVCRACGNTFGMFRRPRTSYRCRCGGEGCHLEYQQVVDIVVAWAP